MTTDTSPTSEGSEVPPPRRRRVMRRVRVTRVEQLTPRMVRVTFTGDDLGAFAWNGPAAHIKLIFPEEGQVEPPLPQPDGPRSTRMRTYTPRRFDPVVLNSMSSLCCTAMVPRRTGLRKRKWGKR